MRTNLLYLVPIVFVPLLMFAAAFFIIPSSWFTLRAGNTYMANLGYGAKLKDQNCQVLIYGDSTALVGVDPAVITRQTNLSACNIAEFAGVTIISGTEPVDTFLARNPRPKYIVFLYAPENFSRPSAWEYVGFFESITYRVREDHSFSTAKALALHPSATLSWAEQGLRMALLRVRSKPFSAEKAHLRERDRGQLKVTNEPAMQHCEGKPLLFPPDPAWVQHLRTQYAVGGTRVILDATPVMNCDAGLPFYQAHLAGQVDDLPLQTYPVTDYVGGGQRLHTNASGSAKLSVMIASQIQAMQEGR